jgi:HNH endonuclease
MPRGAKVDRQVTKLLRAEGFFKDKRSFLGWREAVPHLYLKGVDMSLQREKVLDRDGYKCRECGNELRVDEGEVHHVKHRGQGGSDDLANLEAICSADHRYAHVRPKWGPSRDAAIKDFEGVHNER